MKRGDIYFANLDPTIGKEIKKKRPALIISNNASNNVSEIVTIIPLTSNTKKVFPFEVLLETKYTGLKKTSKAQCHQIRAISKLRLEKNRAGIVNDDNIERIEHALKLHLNLF